MKLNCILCTILASALILLSSCATSAFVDGCVQGRVILDKACDYRDSACRSAVESTCDKLEGSIVNPNEIRPFNRRV